MLSEPCERIPIWFMRQAGRYLPEYKKVRARAGSMVSLMRNPELASEVTLQPVTRFGLDAAILFSDILTIPDAMGLGLAFVEGEGPRFQTKVGSLEDVLRLPEDVSDRLGYVYEAAARARRELPQDAALIGFSGSPFTLACYMIEGGSSGDYASVSKMLYQDPSTLSSLLDKLSRSVAEYLFLQHKAGAQALMIFDSWGGLLPDGKFERFSLAYIRNVIAILRSKIPGRDVPIIVFSKRSSEWLPSILSADIDVIGLDAHTSIARAIDLLPRPICLQGNLDPMALFGAPASVRAEVDRVIDQVSGRSERFGYVFNLGHGIDKDTPMDSVYAMVEAVKARRRAP